MREKFIKRLACMLCMFGMVTATVAYAENSVNFDGISLNEFKATAVSDKPSEDMSVLGVYNENGELVAVDTGVIGENGFEMSIDTACFDNTGEYTAKGFLFDKASMKPEMDYASAKIVSVEKRAWDVECFEGSLESASEVLVSENPYIYYYTTCQDEESVKYDLSADYKLLVNGIEFEKTTDNIMGYLFYNKNGRVKFIDLPDAGGAFDGFYDIVDVDFYAVGTVTEADDTQAECELFFHWGDSISSSTIVIEAKATEEPELCILRYNGEKISVSDVQVGDVVSMKYNPTGGFGDTELFIADITRDKARAEVTAYDDEKEMIYLDGVGYHFFGDTYSDEYYSAFIGNLWDIVLDKFGNIAWAEIYDYKKEAVEAVNFGIIKSAEYSADDDEYTVKLYDQNAQLNTFVVDEDMFDTVSWENFKAMADSEEISERCIEYLLNSKGELRGYNLYTPYGGLGIYNEQNSEISNVKINEYTKIISMKNGKVEAVKANSLIDGKKYTAYGYEENDGVYWFVVITENKVIDGTQHFAVVNKVTQGTDNDGVECDKIELYGYDSDEAYTVFVDGVNVVADTLKKGNVIVYNLNSDGKLPVDGYTVIFEGSAATYIDYAREADINSADWYAELITVPDTWKTGNTDVEMRFGPVIDRSSGSITLGEVTTGVFDGAEHRVTYTEGVDLFCYADEVNVIVCDYNNSSSRRLCAGTTASVAKTHVASKIMLEDEYEDRTIIDWDNEDTPQAVYALIKLVDGEVTDVFVIIPKD